MDATERADTANPKECLRFAWGYMRSRTAGRFLDDHPGEGLGDVNCLV